MSRTIDTAGDLAPEIRTFAHTLRAEGKKEKTIRTYCEAVVWLAQRPDSGNSLASWSDITKKDIRTHMVWLLDNYSPAYASNQFRALQQFFSYLADEEEIPNPMTGMTPPPVPQKLVPVLADGELSKLLATCPGKSFNEVRDRAIILLFQSSGARLAEVANMRVTDVDLDTSQGIVTGKNSKMRIVKFSPVATLALSRYLRARGKLGVRSDALWLGQRGPIHPNAIALMLRRRGDKAGIHANAHRFRHDFSHRWMAAGGESTDLMQLNGWNSQAMVARYGASAAAERARANYDRVMAG